AEVLPLKFVSPPYVATRDLFPAVVDVRLHVPRATAAKQVSVPSETVTLPVGVPAPGAVTATAHVTGYAWPTDVVAARAAPFVMVVVVLALLIVCGALAELLGRKF